jgi:hypothetical protein
MIWTILVAFMFAALEINTALAANWLCTPEIATGFVYDGENWVSNDFQPDKQILVREWDNTISFYESPASEPAYVAVFVGTNVAISTFNSKPFGTSNIAQSDGGWYTLSINIDTRAFSLLFSRSYLLHPNGHVFPPVLQLGRCDKL